MNARTGRERHRDRDTDRQTDRQSQHGQIYKDKERQRHLKGNVSLDINIRNSETTLTLEIRSKK